MKRKTKTHEEKIAENYFRVDKEDLDRATEKPVKENFDRENYLKTSVEKKVLPSNTEYRGTIEKSYKKPDRKDLELVEKAGKTLEQKVKRKSTRKKTTRKKTTRKKTARKSIKKEIKFAPPKVSLKKSGYELIVTEKPQAAAKIAAALGKATKRDYNRIPYYEVQREGKEIIVANAVGHLFTLKQEKGNSSEYPIFDIIWIPNYLARKADFTKKYYDTLVKLVKGASSITVATDFDVEGEVIGLNVVRFIAGQQDASRMKYSTLTNKELNEAYDHKSETLDWGQAIAGETRHYLDWFYGINLSRALMSAIKSTGRFKIMSVGRVQGPALKLIVDREREIRKFKPEPYFQAFITVDDNKNKLELKHIKDIFDKTKLKDFENLTGQNAEAETTKREQFLPPLEPFNLTTLQTEAYKFHGITPSQTLQAAQSLYLAGLISYPRTSSQKLPPSIGYKEILQKLAKEYKVEKLMKRDKPVEGKKSDPAHPSIYPTGNKQILSGREEKIYNLIVRRFLSLFCEDAIIDNKTVKATTENKLIFSTRGMQIRKKAWLEIYPSKQKETEVPDMNGIVKIIDSRIEEKETQPPKRYSPASIVSQLEKKNLGTKATRSSILETLYDRGYIKGTSIEATPLGISLIETLEKYSPVIIDEKLTRKFEQQMESIAGKEVTIDADETKTPLEKETPKIKTSTREILQKKEDKIITEAKKTITSIAKDFEKSKEKIGEELVQATDDLREIERKENTLNQCPKCNKGNLQIMYSPKTKRQFVGCGNYPECKNTFSLPPNGLIKPAKKDCEECGFPMLIRLSKGKRPWTFCFNPECKTNKERMEEYRKKQEEGEQ